MNFSCFLLVFKYFERRILHGKYENGFQKDRTSEWCRSSTFLTGCIHWFWRSKCFLSGWPCGSVRVKNAHRSASVPYYGRQKFMGTNLSLCISNQFIWIEISMCPVCRGGIGSAGSVTGRDGFGPPVFWHCLNCINELWFSFFLPGCDKNTIAPAVACSREWEAYGVAACFKLRRIRRFILVGGGVRSSRSTLSSMVMDSVWWPWPRNYGSLWTFCTNVEDRHIGYPASSWAVNHLHILLTYCKYIILRRNFFYR